MEPGTSDNSITALAMVRASKSGKTILSMKDIGSTTGQTAEEDSFTPMEMCTRESGKTIKRMVGVSIPRSMDPTILVNGMRTFSKALALKNGPTVLRIRENISKDSNMAKESSLGLTAQSTRATSKRI